MWKDGIHYFNFSGVTLIYWIFGLSLGFSTFFWNNGMPEDKCYFNSVISSSYLMVFVVVGISLPCITLIIFYVLIYFSIRKAFRNFVCINMKRIQMREIRATINITIVVATFVAFQMVYILNNLVNFYI
jgi:hypothetical protein